MLRLPWETGLVLEVINGMQDYQSWKVRFSQSKKRAWLVQLYKFESLKKNICEQKMGIPSNEIQGMPKFLLDKPIHTKLRRI